MILTMEEIAISLIHLHQDLDSIQFQSLSLLDDIPFFDFDDIANGEKRKLLIMLERFANTNLCLMHSFQENKKFFNGPVFNHIKDKTRCNCYCISCETIGFEDTDERISWTPTAGNLHTISTNNLGSDHRLTRLGPII